MRIALLLVGCLLLGSVSAQDPTNPNTPVSAADRMQEIESMREKAFKDWRAAIDEARESAKNRVPGKKVKAMPMRPDYGPVAKKAAEFAAEFVGTDDAVQFLMISVQAGTDKGVQKSAIETMLKSHIDSPQLAQMGRMLEHLDRMIDPEFAATVKKRMLKSKNADVRGWSLFATHKSAIEDADRDGDDYAAAKKALLAAVEGASDEDLASEIRGAINLRESYGIGCQAPDIAGIDLDGVEFKLSDYKGKVIFLDFWGDW